jgi:hypothetical protein
MSTYEYFTGRFDEVVLYKNALSASQIRDMYLYQGSWVEDRQSRNITVDDKPPSATLEITGTNPYWSGQETVVVISADDADSRVDRLVLSGQKGSTGSVGPWEAVPCAGSGGGNSWCANFVPSGEGAYTL